MGRRRTPADPPTTGTGVTRYIVAVLVLSVLMLVLAVRNSDRVEVDLLVWSGKAPVYALAFVAALLGAAVTALVSSIWRHRRIVLNRERRGSAADLADLRERPAAPDAAAEPPA